MDTKEIERNLIDIQNYIELVSDNILKFRNEKEKVELVMKDPFNLGMINVNLVSKYIFETSLFMNVFGELITKQKSVNDNLKLFIEKTKDEIEDLKREKEKFNEEVAHFNKTRTSLENEEFRPEASEVSEERINALKEITEIHFMRYWNLKNTGARAPLLASEKRRLVSQANSLSEKKVMEIFWQEFLNQKNIDNTKKGITDKTNDNSKDKGNVQKIENEVKKK